MPEENTVPTEATPPPVPPLLPPEGGLVGAWMRKVFGSSWKTSAVGLLAVLSAALPLVPDFDPRWAQATLSLITGLGLMLSKDGNVTGGTHPNVGGPLTPKH